MSTTAVVTGQAPAAQPTAWAGLALPGLGHLLGGHVLDGIGHMLLAGLVLWGGFGGLPRLRALLHAPGNPHFLLHPWVALASLLLAAVLLWGRAWRFAVPAPQDPDAVASDWAVVWKQFRKNRNGVLGMYLVLFLVLMAATTPLLAPFDPDAQDAGERLVGPEWLNVMGTDQYRRDLFSRVLYGARISLTIGFVAVSIEATVGTALGAVAGYFGGWLDRGIMWLTDLLLSLPRLVLLMAIVGFFRAAGAQTIYLIVFIIGLTGWMGVCRIVRSQVLSLKEQDFVQATRALGLPAARIIFRHLVPNSLAPVIVYASLAVGYTILTESSLSFLGLGVPPPTATWGSLVNDGREYLRSAWWYTLFPGLMIVFAVMSFNLLGDGLRDALDPRLRGRE